MCILFVYILLKAGSYCDLSVLSNKSGMGFQKKSLDGGGWGELYQTLFWIFGILLTLHSP